MKTVLKIILGIVVIIMVAISAVFYFTGDLVDSADEFSYYFEYLDTP